MAQSLLPVPCTVSSGQVLNRRSVRYNSGFFQVSAPRDDGTVPSGVDPGLTLAFLGISV